MNVTEANAFNTLMAAVILEGDYVDEALEAAVLLADRSRKTLDAGLQGDQVRERFAIATCRVCGCTDDEACVGGCWWVEADLCSGCQPPDTSFNIGDRVRIGKGKKVWVLKGRACNDPCQHWDATVEGSDGYTNVMVAAERLTKVES